MKAYTIRVTTIDGLYTDYMVEAKNLVQAEKKAQKAFFRDYPDAETTIKTSIANPSKEVLTEIFNIIKEIHIWA